jgi:hypothetical protein
MDPELVHKQTQKVKKNLPAWNATMDMESQGRGLTGEMVERLVELLHGCAPLGAPPITPKKDQKPSEYWRGIIDRLL